VENGPWTAEEEQKLVDLVQQFGASWKHIATFFHSRTDINIKSRWQLRQRRMRKEAARKVVGKSESGRPMMRCDPLPVLPLQQGSVPPVPENAPAAPVVQGVNDGDLPDGALDQAAMSDLWASLMFGEYGGMESADSWF
jgi:hypothetical protein